MREILFRGKDAFGEWQYGSFSREAVEQVCGEENASCGWIRHFNFTTKSMVASKVDRETVSEFIGLYDKSSSYVNGGKKIFEGDIIRCVDTENCIEFVGEVKYYAEDNKYPAFDIDIPLEEKYRFESNVLQTMLLTGWYIEVIGNKWDNPELLKKEN